MTDMIKEVPKHAREESVFMAKRGHLISTMILAAAASICLICSIQIISRGYVRIAGYSAFRVVTGSMEPTIPTGAILFCKSTGIEEIQMGDIVCYRTQVSDIYGSIVTHRVTDVLTDNRGAIYLETRGDANYSADPYYVNQTNLIGRVTWYSGKESFVTNMLSFLSGKVGFFACIVFPILLMSGLILQSSVKSLQKEVEQARRELEKIPVEAEDLLPGYTTLTYADYQAIYETLKKELLDELYGNPSREDTKTE